MRIVVLFYRQCENDNTGKHVHKSFIVQMVCECAFLIVMWVYCCIKLLNCSIVACLNAFPLLKICCACSRDVLLYLTCTFICILLFVAVYERIRAFCCLTCVSGFFFLLRVLKWNVLSMWSYVTLLSNRGQKSYMIPLFTQMCTQVTDSWRLGNN